MKHETMSIGGRSFELMGTVDHLPYLTRRELYDCYDRPSDIKRAIYLDWEKWFTSIGCDEWGISSYNCMVFTLNAKVEHEGKRYYLYITRDHNRAYEIR